jgi:hypothetical protein
MTFDLPEICFRYKDQWDFNDQGEPIAKPGAPQELKEALAAFNKEINAAEAEQMQGVEPLKLKF